MTQRDMKEEDLSIFSGVELIARERSRQVSDEGWDAEHDDEHNLGELALVAALFATPLRLYAKYEYASGIDFKDPWPWQPKWDRRFIHANKTGNVPPNPNTYTRQGRLDLLIKAGALIAAEIDRINRISDNDYREENHDDT